MSAASTLALAPMSDAVRELIDASMHAHGVERWDTLTGLRFSLLARGPMLVMRGRSPFRIPYTVEISTREPRAVLSPFGRAGGRGIYSGDSVSLESAAGELIAERDGARVHARDHLFWDDLDLLYLLGYSFWNYHSVPFLFRRPGFQAIELATIRDPANGRPLRRVRFQYPADVPTHCSDQVFYFDERSLIVRLDYGAEVFNPKRRGAHLCTEYKDYGGLMVPGHRRAVPFARGTRRVPLLPTLMEAWVDNVQLLADATPSPRTGSARAAS